MLWLAALSLGLAVGGAVGFLAEQVPVAAVLQSAAAGLVANRLATLSMAAVLMLRDRAHGYGLFGVRMDLFSGRALVWAVVLCAAFAVLHLVLARFSVPLHASHPAIVIGCIGGLVWTLPIAWALVARG